MLDYASTFFIVRDIRTSVAYYTDVLGFRCLFLVPEEAPFLAAVSRNGVSFTLKEIGPETPPLPNMERHEDARWDVYVHTPDPDALYAELEPRGARVHVPLGDHPHDGLRSFELRDADGYVLAFGRPL